MRKLVPVLLCLFVFLLGCDQSIDPTEMCFVEGVNSPSNHEATGSDLNLAKALLDRNHIDYSSMRIIRLQEDTQLGGHLIRLTPFVNGLEVFDEQVMYYFNVAQQLYRSKGNENLEIDLHIESRLSTQDVTDIFQKTIADSPSAKLIEKNFSKSCFSPRLGYRDLNIGMGLNESRFAKVWKVTPKKADYPRMFIHDETGEVLSYDSGVRN